MEGEGGGREEMWKGGIVGVNGEEGEGIVVRRQRHRGWDPAALFRGSAGANRIILQLLSKT